MNTTGLNDDSIAIIGMAGRFPGARNVDEFWRNLRDGVESISFFTDEEVQGTWIEGPPPKGDPAFVKARGVVEKPEWFDAGFFNMTPREAEIMDPQQRVFLECAWEALENAGCNPDTFGGLAGVFAGSSMNSYLLYNLLSHRNVNALLGGDNFSLRLAADKDFMVTRVSYKLNLQGPSVNVQTACSTSLMAVSMACQNLLSYQCDLALAGGVAITFPQKKGQIYQEGGIIAPDGHCRAFDADAAGTTFSDGAGVVVLKRLADAQADGDRICAVIRGSALNNDGARKVGYTAPSIDGQAEVIALAHAAAGVDPASISYVETHGTGTPLGDPIEIAGLVKAFGPRAGKQTCAIGSLKANVGHMDVAAGVAGLIKTVCALQQRQLPPLLHFKKANGKIDFADSPFYPNTALKDWSNGAGPRRAGVSAFGFGGTNVHVVLEEAPQPAPTTQAHPWQLLTLSARSPSALEATTTALVEHLRQNPRVNLADVAFTLQVGRKHFECRRAVVCRDLDDAIETLSSGDAARLPSGRAGDARPSVAFLFPGQGAQHADMGHELYLTEPVFRGQVDQSCEILKPYLGLDLRSIIFPPADRKEEAGRQLAQTSLTQPALFVIEHALAKLWMHRGIRPQGMIGHSLGEYVAACLAGVFTLEDALRLVTERARLMQQMAPGVMMAVRMAEQPLRDLLTPELALAAINASQLCVVSGPSEAIASLEKELACRGVAGRRLVTSHAFHSQMMEAMLPQFSQIVKDTPMHPPQLPWVSNTTGRWITPDQAVDPDYWVEHVRRTVRFADSLGELAERGITALLEVGPGQTLVTLARQHPVIAEAVGKNVAGSLAAPGGKESDRAVMLKSLGRLWQAGAPVVWPGNSKHERRQRLALPTYPFERKRHWIEPAPLVDGGDSSPGLNGRAHPELSNQIVDTDVRPAPAAVPGSPAGSLTLAALRSLFRDLSGVELEQAAPGATFFELGFDSLFLTQASLAVHNRFKIRVTLRQMLDDFATLEALADHLDAQAEAASPPAVAGRAVAPVAGSATQEVPLTEEQHEVWFASQMSTGACAAYNESSTVRLAGALDIAALRQAVRQLVDRHEALRATFSPAGDFQRIAASLEIDVPVVDCTHLTGREQELEIGAVINHTVGAEFDLAAGPLLRAQLIRVSEREHLLVFVVHHLVSDGWSQGILMCDLGELYSANCSGKPCALPPAARFGDYARSHSARRLTPEFAVAEAYWVNQFADSVPVLELPSDRPRPAERTYAGACRSGRLSPDIAEVVKRLCEERGCTAFTVLLSAFSLLLHRLSGQEDIVVGVPAAAQVLDGMDNLVGHCANVLPVRSRITEELRFNDYLAVGRGKLLEALEHWWHPLGNLVRKLNLPRDSNRVPLVNVVFNSTRIREALHYEGLSAEVIGEAKTFVNFDLSFNLDSVDDESLFFNVYYSTELFNEGTIDRLVGEYETLLRGIAADSAQAVSRLPLLNEAERRKILVEWNSARVDFPWNRCIHDLFSAQVRRNPEAIALVFGRDRITYRELDHWSDGIARRLRALDIRPDTLVGIFLERTPALVAAMLGVFKSGGAYVPLDPVYPRERLEMIIEDSGMEVLLTSENLPRPDVGESKLLLIEVSGPPDGEPVVDDTPQFSGLYASGNLAYVLYTSGSTGRPKGVEIEHRSVVSLIAWAQSVYSPEQFAGVLAATSVCFDLSVFELFFPLCSGGKVILAENILGLADLPAVSEVTLINTVPSAIAELLQAGRIPATIGTINLAGEALSQDLVDELYQKTSVERVYDLYGPTETTVYSTFALRVPGGRATIGRPLANEQAYILDQWRQPVPVGVPGELYIGGTGLARGYLRQLELTAEKFVGNPFHHGTRLYRTGDLVRYREDGNIEYFGRLDHQVKLRGFRIELGDIETALRRHPAVRDAVAMVRTDRGVGQQLIAYIVTADHTADAQQLRAHLIKIIPGYMIPSVFVVLEKLPLTPNGKVDRRALPAPDSHRTGGDKPITPPRTTTEEVLVDIWLGVLGLERIGIDDNFFESGGHSLMATQVLSRVREAFQVELPLRQFFAAPVIADQAAAIEAAMVEEIKQQSEDDETAAGRVVAESMASDGRTL